jgi:hypothetical protein
MVTTRLDLREASPEYHRPRPRRRRAARYGWSEAGPALDHGHHGRLPRARAMGGAWISSFL